MGGSQAGYDTVKGVTYAAAVYGIAVGMPSLAAQRYAEEHMPNEAFGSDTKDIAQQTKEWLGSDARIITNKSGDKIFMSDDGTKRVRFDINNTTPHNNPHAHIEEFIISG